MLFFFIRHGDPIYEPDSLTPLGHRQAEAVAKRLALYGLDEIYASTSTRAYQTSIPTSELLKLPVTKLDWASENHAWKELSVADRSNWVFVDPASREVLRKPETYALGRNWYKQPFFKGTTYGAGIERIQKASDAFFASLGYRHDLDQNAYVVEKVNDHRVALFAHQGFGLAFMSCVLDIPYSFLATRFDMSHSNLTVIEFAGREGEVIIPRVLTFSNDSHLYREGLPTKYQNEIFF